MTLVSIDLRTPSAAGPVGAVGSVQFTPTRRRRDEEGAVHLPDTFAVPLVDGRALVRLEPTGPGWCWKVQEWIGSQGGTRYVLVPASLDTIAYPDLVDVDPATLMPDAEPAPAWWAAIEALQAELAELEGASPEEIATAVEAFLAENPVTLPGWQEVPGLADVIAALQSGKADVEDLPDLSGYATKAELGQKADADHTHPEYLTEADLPDLSGYATKAELGQKADADHTHEQYLTEADLPDLSGYATKAELGQKADADHTHPEYLTEADLPDLSGYATKAELDGKADAGHTHEQYLTEADLPPTPWVALTQAEYDALEAVDPSVLYVVIG